MQINIQTSGFSLTEALKSYTTTRMQFALDRKDNYITRVQIWLADINGPRGGIDKRCQIELKLAGQNNIVIEDIEADLYFAIDRASDRCMRTLGRRLARIKQHAHEMPSVSPQ